MVLQTIQTGYPGDATVGFPGASSLYLALSEYFCGPIPRNLENLLGKKHHRIENYTTQRKSSLNFVAFTFSMSY
jgi:hypothetical protein